MGGMASTPPPPSSLVRPRVKNHAEERELFPLLLLEKEKKEMYTAEIKDKHKNETYNWSQKVINVSLQLKWTLIHCLFELWQHDGFLRFTEKHSVLPPPCSVQMENSIHQSLPSLLRSRSEGVKQCAQEVARKGDLPNGGRAKRRITFQTKIGGSVFFVQRQTEKFGLFRQLFRTFHFSTGRTR